MFVLLTDEDLASIKCEIEDKEDGSAILHIDCSDNAHKWFLEQADNEGLTFEEFINKILREEIEKVNEKSNYIVTPEDGNEEFSDTFEGFPVVGKGSFFVVIRCSDKEVEELRDRVGDKYSIDKEEVNEAI